MNRREKNDAIVREILAEMSQRQWSTDDDGPPLAERFGVSLALIGDRAAEASRFLRLLVTPADRDELRRRWLVRLDAIVMTGENRDAIAAVRVAADVAGLIVSRNEYTVSGGAPAALDLSPEDQANLHEAAARALRSGMDGHHDR